MKSDIKKFDHEEVWNLDVSLAKFLWTRLRVLRKETNGFPPELTYKEWKRLLKKTEKTFKAYIKLKFKVPPPYLQTDVDEAFDFIKKYFTHLWW